MVRIRYIYIFFIAVLFTEMNDTFTFVHLHCYYPHS